MQHINGHKHMPSNNPFLIVGLGNPGNEYQNTRHNIGFLVLEELSTRLFPHNKWTQKKTDKCSIIESLSDGRRLTLSMPQTFMNLSGESVSRTIKNMPDNTELLVIHDDIDLDKGLVRVSINSSSGGHNGVKSIINSIGNQNFIRIRIGIREERHASLSDFVLSKFSKDDLDDYKKIINKVCDLIVESLSDEFKSQTINTYE